jgi:hypothetical protein
MEIVYLNHLHKANPKARPPMVLPLDSRPRQYILLQDKGAIYGNANTQHPC